MIQVFNPLSLGILKHLGEMNVDVAVGEGQPLGIPLQFGGPYLGLFATKQQYVRKMPAASSARRPTPRASVRSASRSRRASSTSAGEKATSNVCTNQGLLLLRASVYLATMGLAGLRQAAQLCFNKTSYLVDRLKAAGLSLRFPDKPFFNEVLVQLKRPVEEVVKTANAAGVLAGYPVGRYYPDLSDCLLIAVTEKRTRAEIDRLVELLTGDPATENAIGASAAADSAELARTDVARCALPQHVPD